MSERTVVFRAGPQSEASESVAERLRAGGVEIVEQQPNMLLVAGARQAISKALGDAGGWKLTAETTTPPPKTREKILKPPVR
ncbi:hypothetical protein [Bradyrhizobium guangzhouense]|uniref:Uncharacterized protein n=1 Tax=Bradyrhizobium guangzhouense TaxID=1325095 RepID=A0AAE5X0K4_9BRAD|nr:hypothetical protein [Bradyrhizobium guangzhouense]QAU46319.1 hypothetical protein XH91_13740 [Bradyrhizobium guangzhouense]RXH05021.1 hypothetical protein EAS56_36130 [Bradyrhizobium guangzhouense]